MRIIKYILLVSLVSSSCLARERGGAKGRKQGKSEPKTVTIKVPIEPNKTAQNQMLKGILAGSLDEVKQAISAGADVNKLDADGRTPVWLAVRRGKFNIVNLLLESGVNSDLLKDNKVAQAVVDELKGDIAKCLGLLASKGVDFSFAEPSMAQAIRLLTLKDDAQTESQSKQEAQENPVVHPEPKQEPVVQTEVQDQPISKALPLSQAQIEAQAQLNKAIFDGSVDQVKQAISAGASVNHPDVNGKTPLALAVLLKKTDVVIVLIESGAKVDPKTMQDAAKIGDIKTMLAIVKSGADVSPYMQEYMRMCTRIHDRKLTEAALELMQELIARGYNINDIWKIQANDGGIYEKLDGRGLKLVLEKGANPNQVTTVHRYGGQTPLMMAISRYNTQAVKTVVEAGADVNQKAIAFTVKGQQMLTPLSYAITNGKSEIIQYLLEHGAKE